MTNVRNEAIMVQVQRNWGWLLGLGILFVFLGCLGLGMVVGLTIVSILFLGILFIIGGTAQLIDAFKCKQWKGVLWHALVAFLYIAIGGLIIDDPILASTLITALLAWVFILIGITRLMMAFTLRHMGGTIWLVLAGLCALFIGGVMLMQWPVSGLWFIGLFISIEMMINGWSYIFVALAMRQRE